MELTTDELRDRSDRIVTILDSSVTRQKSTGKRASSWWLNCDFCSSACPNSSLIEITSLIFKLATAGSGKLIFFLNLKFLLVQKFSPKQSLYRENRLVSSTGSNLHHFWRRLAVLHPKNQSRLLLFLQQNLIAALELILATGISLRIWLSGLAVISLIHYFGFRERALSFRRRRCDAQKSEVDTLKLLSRLNLSRDTYTH